MFHNEDYKVKLNEITAMATLHRIQKGLKRPTLAWNEIPFVTLPPPPEKKTMSTSSFG